MKLVDGWQNFWKWWSVRALAVFAALPLVWPSLPVEVRDWIPPDWRPWLLVALAVGGIAGRVIDQGVPDKPAGLPDTPGA